MRMASEAHGVNDVRTGPHRLGLWTWIARLLGLTAAMMSRMAGRGSGSIVGGRVMLRLAPGALHRMARGRSVVLVTGTNGKTTTTRMLASALALTGPVVSNSRGSNMPDGLVSALARDLRSPSAVLEVDEPHLDIVSAQVRPQTIVLLNLSRDQLDRVGEVRMLEARLRRAIAAHPQALVVANADDPLVVSAAMDAPRTVWVAVGSGWLEDKTTCPRCAGRIDMSVVEWSCGCGLRRPEPSWWLDDDKLVLATGEVLPLNLRLPGRVNRANAAMALATAAELGTAPEIAMPVLSVLSDVEGRYRQVRLHGRSARFLLAKNPAGWSEMLTMLDNDTSPIVVAVNGRVPDGCDLSWLWDVPFERLRGHTLVASGERAADLAVRLAYAEVDHRIEPDPLAAIAVADSGDVEVVANYTAFQDLLARTRHLTVGNHV
jgi:UDP-N-acetylmuramyl tripeptide synthase